MGLDITAVSHLKDAGLEPKDFDWDVNWGEYHLAFAYDGFERSTRGLKMGHIYRRTEESERHGFRAGSYGGYNHWRQDLAEYAGLTTADYFGCEDTGQPFFELINFADNEGTIGPEAAKDLLEDFLAHREAYVLPPRDEWDVEKYDHWITACRLASADGIIIFH